MQVLLTSHLYPNPATPLLGTFVAELAAAQAAYASVSVVAPVAWFPLLREAHAVPLQRQEGPVHVFHPRRLVHPPPLRDLRWRPHLHALEGSGVQGPWDIIHAHWLDPDAYAVTRWAAARDARLVATVHGHAALGLGTLGRPSPLIRRALRGMDHVVAVSSELRDLVVNHFGVAPERVSVRFNGIDPRLFRLMDRERARRRLGLPLNRRIVLNVARLSPEKRHDVLLEAVAHCPDRDFQVHLAGGGPLADSLPAAIRQAGLENRVFLEGGVAHDALPDWFAAADLFCLTSAHEGCPVVIHEALACGVPIVSTRVGAVPDLVGPESGLLCAPGDAAGLAAALAAALARPWDRTAIAEAGGRHTWDAVARGLNETYAALLASPRLTAPALPV